MAKRIQLRRTKGWRLPAGAVVVARPHLFGNPFRAERLGAGVAVQKYRENLTAEDVALIRERLRGKDLACWCPLDKPCHADVLLEIANKKE